MAAGVRRIIDGMDVARVIGQNEQTLPGPNAEVLEAQARVCTGPHQARPLGRDGDDPRPERVLALIVASLRGEPAWEERVSAAQMGAFFAAMTIRRGFQPQTNWSVAEATAIEASWGTLMQELPVELRFLLEPDRGCAAASIAETPVIDALADKTADSLDLALQTMSDRHEKRCAKLNSEIALRARSASSLSRPSAWAAHGSDRSR